MTEIMDNSIHGKIKRIKMTNIKMARIFFSFLVGYVEEGHGGPYYKAPTKEERRTRKAKRRERSDQVY